MALCDPCRDGNHAAHRAKDEREKWRKGRVVGHHRIECWCATCVLGARPP